jgi:poly(3-hydroxybutyrate) depolymerase
LLPFEATFAFAFSVFALFLSRCAPRVICPLNEPLKKISDKENKGSSDPLHFPFQQRCDGGKHDSRASRTALARIWNSLNTCEENRTCTPRPVSPITSQYRQEKSKQLESLRRLKQVETPPDKSRRFGGDILKSTIHTPLFRSKAFDEEKRNKSRTFPH